MARLFGDGQIDDLQDLLLHVGQLYRDGQWEEALNVYKYLQVAAPTNVIGWNGASACLYRLARYHDSFRIARHATAMRPDSPESWNNLGKALSKLQRYHEAIRAFKRAIHTSQVTDKKWVADIWMALGYAWERLQRPDKALHAYQAAASLNPHLARAWNDIAAMFFHQHRFEEALAASEEAIQCDSSLYTAWHIKGITLRQMGKPQEAAKMIEHALQLAPDSVNTWISKGNICLDLQDLPEALRAYEQALTIQPDSASAAQGKARALFFIQQEAELEHHQELPEYHQELNVWGTNLEKDVRQAYALCDADQTVEALALLDDVFINELSKVKYWYAKSCLLGYVGRYEEAIVCMWQAQDLKPRNPEIWFCLGYYYELNGQDVEAMRAFKQALELEPNMQKAHMHFQRCQQESETEE